MFDASHLTLAYLLAEWAIRLVMIVVIPLRRPPEAARSWLLLVLFLPIPAFILYRLIGRASFPAWRRNRFAKTEPERARIAESLWDPSLPQSRLSLLAEALGGFPASSGHRIKLLTDYEETVRAMHTLVMQGKICYWGTSEWSASEIEDFFFLKSNH